MNPVLIGIIGLVILLLFLAFGHKIGFAMALVAFLGVYYVTSLDAGLSKLGLIPLEVAGSYDLSTLPLFLLMANVIFASGFGKDLYNLAAKWLGHQPGGLAMATIGGCALFAAISASSLATALTIGLVALPEMKKYKYHPALATGCIAGGGTLGILIPPSGMLIIYGIITETSIGKLFVAGIIPGILIAIFYMIVIVILCWRNPALGPRGPQINLKEKILAFNSCIEIIVLVIFVLGGLIVGWFTPTESGAMGAFGAILFSLIRRRLNWTKFLEAIRDTLKLTGMIYAIMIGAILFKYFMGLAGIPIVLANFMDSLSLPPLAIMGVIIFIYLILGCFMEANAMVTLTIPIFIPLVQATGFDLVWFGIIVVRVVEVGLCTPPIGMICYNIAAISDLPVTTVFKGVFPFVLADLVHVTLLVFFPSIALFLPRLMM
jgi:C4-dicarboxylate transporter DctM subunit